MIPIGFGISAAAVVVVGSVALGTVLIAPPPLPPTSVWLDEPVTGAELAPGGTLVNIHASTRRSLVQFRVIVSKGPEVVTVLNDTSPDSVSFGERAVPLSSGSMQWKPEPGVYTLTPSYLDTSAWTTGNPITVTIGDGAFVLPSGPAPIPLPGKSTPVPTEEPTLPPEEQPDPSDPGSAPTTPPAQSTPAPSATTPPSTPATPPTGTVRRQVTGATTTFVAEGVSPQNAIVDVQYQVTNDYNGPAVLSGTWSSVGCGTLSAQAGTSPTKYTCTTAAWTVPGRSSSYRTAHIRVVVTSAGGTVTTYGSSWLIDPSVN
jgi:hypothetical protein